LEEMHWDIAAPWGLEMLALAATIVGNVAIL